MTFSNPKYKDSQISAWPIDTSKRLGMFCLKNWILSSDKSWPALIPKSLAVATSAEAIYFLIAALGSLE